MAETEPPGEQGEQKYKILQSTASACVHENPAIPEQKLRRCIHT